MLWDITSGRLVQRLLGRPPGSFVVRSAFGGPQDNFVLSGCEGLSSNTLCVPRLVLTFFRSLLVLQIQTAMYTFGTVLQERSSRSFLDIRRKASIRLFGVPPP
jgi:hypothetical protein